MKRFLISVILLLSLSALFATEEQVFAIIDAIVKNSHGKLEEKEKILFENGFIPVSQGISYDNPQSYMQNYFGDTQVIAECYILNEGTSGIFFTFEPPNNKEFTVTAQKILQYFTNKYEYIYEGYNEIYKSFNETVLRHEWDFSQKEYRFRIWYEANGGIEIVITPELYFDRRSQYW